MVIRQKLGIMDSLVIICWSIAIVVPILLIFAPGVTIREYLSAHKSIPRALGAASAIILTLWLCLGGLRSPLWNWLPPFCLFRSTIVWRLIVSVGMIVGTVVGVLNL
jgi:hypothetical protein